MDRSLIISSLILNIVSSLAFLGVVLKHHKIWVRLRDQHTLMYKGYCNEHSIPYQSLDNGKGE